jgi:hypothetical protein
LRPDRPPGPLCGDARRAPHRPGRERRARGWRCVGDGAAARVPGEARRGCRGAALAGCGQSPAAGGGMAARRMIPERAPACLACGGRAAATRCGGEGGGSRLSAEPHTRSGRDAPQPPGRAPGIPEAMRPVRGGVRVAWVATGAGLQAACRAGHGATSSPFFPRGARLAALRTARPWPLARRPVPGAWLEGARGPAALGGLGGGWGGLRNPPQKTQAPCG